MSYNDLCNYCSDLQRAQRLLAEGVNVRSIFINIKHQKANAELYGKPYISVFEEVSL